MNKLLMIVILKLRIATSYSDGKQNLSQNECGPGFCIENTLQELNGSIILLNNAGTLPTYRDRYSSG